MGSKNLLNFLKINGPTLSSELVDRLGISRASLSRRVREEGSRIVSIGKARATRLAARDEGLSEAVALYQVQTNGEVLFVGALHALADGEHTQWYFESEGGQESLMGGEFKHGLFPGWPWFLDDMRPQGFLGRAFGKRMAKLFQYQDSPDTWSDLQLLNALKGFGWNSHGNFILGDANALQAFQAHKLRVADGFYNKISPTTYPQQARKALEEDEAYGSSAGGEQPKFTSMVCDEEHSMPRSVIVKFSPKIDTPVGKRWADLLHSEDVSNQVLREIGFSVAETRIFVFESRVFLESLRFDRAGALGRRGLVSLRSLDAAYIGTGQGSWAKVARVLHTDGWISSGDCRRIIQLQCFGELIGNSDMHWGNLSFFLPKNGSFPLAPVYDMLPMFFRPTNTGELLERVFKLRLPNPEDQNEWLEMHSHAMTFWRRIIDHSGISRDFKAIAKDALAAVNRLPGVVMSNKA
ncbi:MAG: type II toxin-antitoxin system HipA family toxin YjjJ [Opitutales bacterium]|nr:type II toxin-antitoxin system HipA family toxin YjjJ [Opitutales bacterium]